MRRFVEGIDREQATLFPECLEDWIDKDNSVRAIDAFVDRLDLSGLGFDGVAPETTGRPSYHPLGLLKLYIYGYLNRVQSSRRLEREAGRAKRVPQLRHPGAASGSEPASWRGQRGHTSFRRPVRETRRPQLSEFQAW